MDADAATAGSSGPLANLAARQGTSGREVPADSSGGMGRPGTRQAVPQLRRFHGSVKVDPLRLGRDAARIAEEVVQHLTGLLGTNVEITLEIHADLAENVSDKTIRDVTENCRTLRFETYGFEEQ